MWTSTGNLTNVRKNAGFAFGVAMLPAHNGAARRPAAATSICSRIMTGRARGGLQVRQVDDVAGARRELGYSDRLCRRAARRLGYTDDEAIRRGLSRRHPRARQAKYWWLRDVDARNSTCHQAVHDGLQAALIDTKTPQQAMADAQQEAARILQPYPSSHRHLFIAVALKAPRGRVAFALTRRRRDVRWHVVYGWLLLLPAAVLLVAVHALSRR